MRVCKCDICGAEIPLDSNQRTLPYNFSGKTWRYKGFDLCKGCLDELDYVRNKAVADFIDGAVAKRKVSV